MIDLWTMHWYLLISQLLYTKNRSGLGHVSSLSFFFIFHQNYFVCWICLLFMLEKNLYFVRVYWLIIYYIIILILSRTNLTQSYLSFLFLFLNLSITCILINWQYSITIFCAIAIVGSHTIGNSRCTSFRQRLYNQIGNGKADFTLHQYYAAELRSGCPRSGGDQNLFFLDPVTPTEFDNTYFKNLLAYKGLLNSDEVLLTMNQESAQLVKLYAERNDLFFEQFAKSMVKMGNISPLTRSRGQIRTNCRMINTWWSNISLP